MYDYKSEITQVPIDSLIDNMGKVISKISTPVAKAYNDSSDNTKLCLITGLITVLILLLTLLLVLYLKCQTFKNIVNNFFSRIRIKIHCVNSKVEINVSSKSNNHTTLDLEEADKINSVDFTALNLNDQNCTILLSSNTSYNSTASPSAPPLLNKYSCIETNCSYSTKNLFSLKHHSANHVEYKNKLYKCQFCKYGSNSQGGLQSHYKNSHYNN